MSVIAGGGDTPVANLAWLLDDLAGRLADFRRAVILSRDGLLIAASKDLSDENAGKLKSVVESVAKSIG